MTTNGHEVSAAGAASEIVAPPVTEREHERTDLCCKRVTRGTATGWCTLDDRHAGDCDGVVREPAPSAALGRGLR